MWTDEHPDRSAGGERGLRRGCEHTARFIEEALRHHQEWLHAVRIM